MALSADLISQFAKITKDDKRGNQGSTVYGTTITVGGQTYVKIDGSDLLTPVSTSVDTKDNERVSVTIKDHTATIDGNMSSPAARTDDVKESATHITELEIVTAYRITTEELNAVTAHIENLKAVVGKFTNISVEDLAAVNAEIEHLTAKFADVEYITAQDVRAANATIERLEAKIATFTDISTEDLEAANAEIGQLKAYNANFTYVFADELSAINANIKTLNTEKLSAKEASLTYANIDFANIGEAAIKKIFAGSGLIKDIVVGSGTITGELVGVTIKGNYIEGGTIQADKLVVKGEDGLYYKLNIDAGAIASEEVTEEDLQNGLHGDVIIAKSVTADKIAVTDLIAFGATIGGFAIKDTAIHSVVKESVDNITRGIYLDNDGQMAIGDDSQYLKFFVDEDGTYKLIISAGSVLFGHSGMDVETAVTSVSDRTNAIGETVSDLGETVSELGETVDTLRELPNYVDINIDDETKPYVMALGKSGSNFKLHLTGEAINFMDGEDVPAYINNKALNIETAEIKNELYIGGFVLKKRANGNVGFMWNGGIS